MYELLLIILQFSFLTFTNLQVTAASKFLTLQESVRDASDLYLSLKHIPLVFLCDTPCGFVRHLDCRIPEVTQQLWAKFGGCFEEPSLDRAPSMVFIFSCSLTF